MASRRRRKRQLSEQDDEKYLSLREQVCEELRQIQWQTNCSTLTLQCFLKSLRGKLGRLVKECDELPPTAEFADKKMQKMVNMYE